MKVIPLRKRTWWEATKAQRVQVIKEKMARIMRNLDELKREVEGEGRGTGHPDSEKKADPGDGSKVGYFTPDEGGDS